MANDIDLLALNAAISINSLIDFTPSGSKRTASIQLDVIQAIRTALLARGIDPNEPLPPAESVAQGGEDCCDTPAYCSSVRRCTRKDAATPTPATGSGGEAA